MKSRILGFIAWVFYKGISLTWRTTLEEPPEMKALMNPIQPFIMAHWHGDELVLLQLLRRYKVATIASLSKDGEIMNTYLRLEGVLTSRGSSSRGAVGGLKGLLRLVKQGYRCSFAVDGPKGPIHQIKPGVFETSRAMNLPIFAVGISCSSAWTFKKSWNQAYFPKPFAKIAIVWRGPQAIVQRDEDPRSTELQKSLQNLFDVAKHHSAILLAES